MNCACHGEPMIKNGTQNGQQRYVCRVASRQRHKTLYNNTPFGDWKKRREQSRYHDAANQDLVLRKLMRQQTRHHRQKLRKLTEEGGPDSQVSS